MAGEELGAGMNVMGLLILLGAMLLIGLAFRSGGRGSHERYQETDIRLPHQRYKALYPDSGLSYAEYKKLQAREAFKSAVPSKKLKRMVR